MFEGGFYLCLHDQASAFSQTAARRPSPAAHRGPSDPRRRDIISDSRARPLLLPVFRVVLCTIV